MLIIVTYTDMLMHFQIAG